MGPPQQPMLFAPVIPEEGVPLSIFPKVNADV
jgi:hypothetical protein